jgi:nucleotide-binding universal stress UspA family protein
MIIDEAEKNDFDTVIIGRTGSDKAFYFGNVARYVSERIAERAVWVAG